VGNEFFPVPFEGRSALDNIYHRIEVSSEMRQNNSDGSNTNTVLDNLNLKEHQTQMCATNHSTSKPQVYGEEFITENVKVHSKNVGRIIGKGGQNIKRLQQNTNTHMSVVQSTIQGSQAIVEVSGSRQNVENATIELKNLNQSFLVSSQTAIGTYIKSSAVNLFLGHGERNIKEIQGKTRTKIKIDQAEDMTDPQHGGFRRLIIVGRQPDVIRAQETVEKFFADFPTASFSVENIWVQKDPKDFEDWRTEMSEHYSNINEEYCSY
jgi:predicted RNA-binding protein YlqC (UPF0109 family)